MVTVGQVRAFARTLPRTTEVLVHDRVKFRVGAIVYASLSRDETIMGFGFPKAQRASLVRSDPNRFLMPTGGDLRFRWVLARLDALEVAEMRELVLDAWRMCVPKSLAVAHDAGFESISSMTALADGLDLHEALDRTGREGFAHLDGALDERFRRALWEEISRGPLRRMEGSFGKAGVRMQIEGYDVERPFEGFPLLEILRRELGARVRSDGRDIRGLAGWRPNEAGIAVYHPGSVGITAHMDGRWYRRLVAVFTLVGSGAFEVRASREGEVLERWTARSGGVTLMRAPGLAGARDGRPYHAVGGPRRGARCSLALRMSVGRS